VSRRCCFEAKAAWPSFETPTFGRLLRMRTEIGAPSKNEGQEWRTSLQIRHTHGPHPEEPAQRASRRMATLSPDGLSFLATRQNAQRRKIAAYQCLFTWRAQNRVRFGRSERSALTSVY
jgi:hypothetical protein